MRQIKKQNTCTQRNMYGYIYTPYKAAIPSRSAERHRLTRFQGRWGKCVGGKLTGQSRDAPTASSRACGVWAVLSRTDLPPPVISSLFLPLANPPPKSSPQNLRQPPSGIPSRTARLRRRQRLLWSSLFIFPSLLNLFPSSPSLSSTFGSPIVVRRRSAGRAKLDCAFREDGCGTQRPGEVAANRRGGKQREKRRRGERRKNERKQTAEDPNRVYGLGRKQRKTLPSEGK